MSNQVVAGRNAVFEALRSGKSIDCIYLQKGGKVKGVERILSLAKAAGVVVKQVEMQKLDDLAQGVVHQGVCAMVAPVDFVSLDQLFQIADSRKQPPFLVICDEILDPHNLGAIIRSAECAGAQGVILPKRRSAPVNSVVLKTSAGAAEHLALCKVGNIADTIRLLQDKGVWVYCADMDGEDYRKVDFSGPRALVVGSEGKGVSKLVKECCDKVVSLPLKGKINSLNASVAAGILLYQMIDD